MQRSGTLRRHQRTTTIGSACAWRTAHSLVLCLSGSNNPSRSTVVEKLSQPTIDRIVAFAESLVFENEQTLLQILALADDGLIIDLMDSWVDTELQKYVMQTVNNHVRYLRVLLLCQRDHIDLPSVDDVVIEYIVDLVADTQATTTRASTTLNMLKLEDPFALAAIRDAVVNALLKEQVEYIHPYLPDRWRTHRVWHSLPKLARAGHSVHEYTLPHPVLTGAAGS